MNFKVSIAIIFILILSIDIKSQKINSIKIYDQNKLMNNVNTNSNNPKKIINDLVTSSIEEGYLTTFLDSSNISNKKDEFTVLNKLVNKTKNFFKKNGLLLNWQEFQKLTIDQQINTLSMIAPISNEEKQKLLETISTQDKIQTFSKIVEFYNYEKIEEKPTVQ